MSGIRKKTVEMVGVYILVFACFCSYNGSVCSAEHAGVAGGSCRAAIGRAKAGKSRRGFAKTTWMFRRQISMKQDLTEKAISSETIYNGKIVTLNVDKVELPNGRTATREVVRTRDSVAVVPVTRDDKVVLVRQYRYAGGEELLEIPAGRIDPGESPRAAAQRELLEETGCTCAELKKIAGFYIAVGFATEFMHLYAGTVDHIGEACPDDDEFVRTELMPVSQIPEILAKQEIRDVKTLAGLLHLSWMLGLSPVSSCACSICRA